jgi:putative membrane protein
VTPILAHTAGADPWAWKAHPDVWALVAALAVGYWFFVVRRGPTTRRQVAQYATGLVLLWAGSDWPVHELSEGYLLSVHMLQHLLFTLAAPPLLLLGLPEWFVRRRVAQSWLRPLVSGLASPVPAALLFNAVTVVTHWPALVDASLRSEPVHFSVHAVMFVSALLMWFPVVNRVAELPTMTAPVKMLYLFLQSIVPTVPASFLTFADGVIYKFYGEAPRPFAISVVADQQLAGAMMKVIGGGLLWGVIVVIFFRWYAASQRENGDVLTWDDVEREFQRTRAVSQ